MPDERIIWRSTGQKGHVDGAVSFHVLGPNLTRILLVLEYHPQGMFERTGNLWRAQGRRARLELKHFRRHMMTRAVLHPDEIEGWRGTIHDGEVAESHDDAGEREQQESPGRDESRQAGDGQAGDEVRGRGEDESDEEAAGEAGETAATGHGEDEGAGQDEDAEEGTASGRRRRPAGQARSARRTTSQGSSRAARAGTTRAREPRRRAGAAAEQGDST